MTDPLAHLYAEDGLGDDEPLDLPMVETTLEELASDVVTDPEQLSESDVAELALLVRARIDAATMDDAEAVALGLGDFDDDGELVFNAAGQAVFRLLVAQQAVEIGRADG